MENEYITKPSYLGNCYKLTGSPSAAMLLYRIYVLSSKSTFTNSEGESGWVAKYPDEWAVDLCFSVDQYYRALSTLRNKKLLNQHRQPVEKNKKGTPPVWLKLKEHVLKEIEDCEYSVLERKKREKKDIQCSPKDNKKTHNVVTKAETSTCESASSSTLSTCESATRRGVSTCESASSYINTEILNEKDKKEKAAVVKTTTAQELFKKDKKEEVGEDKKYRKKIFNKSSLESKKEKQAKEKNVPPDFKNKKSEKTKTGKDRSLKKYKIPKTDLENTKEKIMDDSKKGIQVLKKKKGKSFDEVESEFKNKKRSREIKNISQFNFFFLDTCAEYYPDEYFISWSKKEQGMAKSVMVKSASLKLDLTTLTESCISRWNDFADYVQQQQNNDYRKDYPCIGHIAANFQLLVHWYNQGNPVQSSAQKKTKKENRYKRTTLEDLIRQEGKGE